MNVRPCMHVQSTECLFTATGDLLCREQFSQPEWIDKESAWKQRTRDGWPLPSTNGENKGKEKQAPFIVHHVDGDMQQKQLCQHLKCIQKNEAEHQTKI